MKFSLKAGQKELVRLLVTIAVIAGLLRFYRITDPQFFFYDEGLYLTNNLDFLEFVDRNPVNTVYKLGRFFDVLTHLALAEAKSLWFFLSNLRGLFYGTDGLFWTRLISALFGVLTFVPTYLLAKKFYDSCAIGFLSPVMLALLPSHFFYSRLGLQESFSTFCFITALYFYLSAKKLSWRVFLSGLFFSFVFLTNYRMIVIPLLLAFIEGFLSFSEKRPFDLRRYIWVTLTFFLVVFFVGHLDRGANTNITFAWMFYQAHLAHEDRFSFFNYLSFPYYIFHLESIPFAILFFGNIYYAFQKEWRRMLPFAIVLFEMMIFSSVQEKGARYLCTVLPLMAIAVSSLIVYLLDTRKRNSILYALGGISALLLIIHVVKIFSILQFHEDYRASINDLRAVDRNVKISSTQPLIQRLYADKPTDVIAAVHQTRLLVALHSQGYHYVIIDPQAYISYTIDGKRFTPHLKGYLGFLDQYVVPYKVYPHYSKALMERFVLEHNIQLKDSLAFLRLNQSGRFGILRVYRIEDFLKQMIQLQKLNKRF